MLEITKKSGFAVYTISSADGRTRASFVPEKGGVGSSIVMPYNGRERELLFLHDNFWQRNNVYDLSGGWPFLFPICARLERMGKAGSYLHDGKIYQMPIHGFAPYLSWKVLQNNASDTLMLELTDSAQTLAMYPFKFKVQLTYKVNNCKLTCEQIYTNIGDKPMPYYAGFHPYFLTPPATNGKAEVVLNYKPLRCLRYNSRLTDIVGEKALFAIPTSVANPEINEQLTEVPVNNIINLTYPDGFNLFMQTTNEGVDNLFRYLQLYTIANKPFICVEPWMAFPNALNTILGTRILAPSCSETACISLCTHL
jgi:galactose mutarotase-like enzyme